MSTTHWYGKIRSSYLTTELKRRIFAVVMDNKNILISSPDRVVVDHVVFHNSKLMSVGKTMRLEIDDSKD